MFARLAFAAPAVRAGPRTAHQRGDLRAQRGPHLGGAAPRAAGTRTIATFEVVVVNDRSEDDTWEVLQWMKPAAPAAAAGEHPGGREIQLRQEDRPGRRGPCREVSARAAHRCRLPARREGLDQHHGRRVHRAASRSSSATVPTPTQPGVANVLERYDGCMKAMQYMSFAMAGLPYMGVGRNLGYTSEVFFNAERPEAAQPPDERRRRPLHQRGGHGEQHRRGGRSAGRS